MIYYWGSGVQGKEAFPALAKLPTSRVALYRLQLSAQHINAIVVFWHYNREENNCVDKGDRRVRGGLQKK